jgi:hypothetical protein
MTPEHFAFIQPGKIELLGAATSKTTAMAKATRKREHDPTLLRALGG